ncbi:MAG: hypothetical protein NXI16_01430 [Alphaproteobacteria bacterium]|nr:hypothetical protein [Alphaproteobacteria bacterium]
MSTIINYHLIPNLAMRGGIERYIEQGVPMGGFLTALASNDLKEACARADSNNSRLIFEWVAWFWNYAPSECWGSPDRVSAWIAAGGLESKREDVA